MILLNGHSRTPARKVPVEALSLQLKERDSTAAMTQADMTGIGTESWFLDDTEPGAGLIWRVSSIGTVYDTHTPTVNLEFITATLRDKILFGEVTPAAITGNPKATTCTARQAVEYILRQQGDWRLGGFECTNVSNAYKFDGDTLWDALESVTNTLTDAWWDYDLSSYPFRLFIRKKTDAVASELRCGRNIRTIRRNIDKSGMYTRFYPIGKDDLHLNSRYREKNTALYGVIEHTETDTSRESESELAAWASEKLSRHAEPTVTIEVDGLELVRATGESLDRLTLGRMCRVPLPEYGTTITERIVGLNYPDKVHEPELVRISLSNQREDVTRIIADAMKSSGRGGRAAARQSKNDHAWFEDTNDHVAMVAEGIVGTDALGNPNWTRLSQIIVDGQGIHQTVQGIQGELVIAQTAIEQNEYEISIRATRDEMDSAITVSADNVKAYVNDTKNEIESGLDISLGKVRAYVDDKDAGLKSEISVERSRIGLVVSGTGSNAKIKPAAITAAINQDGSSNVYLSADKIALDGSTRLSGAMTVRGGNLTVIKTAYLGGGAYITGGNSLTFQTSGTPATNYTMTPAKVAGMIVDARVDGDTLKLWKFNDPAGSPSITFNKPIVQTKVAGSWSNGKVTVQGDASGSLTYVRYLSAGTKEKQDGTAYNGDKQFYVPILVHDGQGTPPTYEQTGYRAYVDATATYNAGRDGVWVDYRDAGQSGYDYNPQGSINTAHAQLALVSEGDVLATWKIPQLQPRTVTANNSGDTFYPLSGYAGLSSVTVNIPVLNHSATLTRVYCSANSSGTRSSSGKLYYYDASSDSYKAASSGDAYWFRASVTIDTSSDGDTKTVNYA